MIRVHYRSFGRVNELYQVFCPRLEWGVMPSSVLHSNGSNGLFVVAPPVSNGYVNHLHEKLAVFRTEDFDAQTYVKSKCQSMNEKILRLIITRTIL